MNSVTVAFRIHRIHQRHDLAELIGDFQGVRPGRVRVSEAGNIFIGGEALMEHRQKVFLEWLQREAPSVYGLQDGIAPTTEEIRDRCREIQNEWSPLERRARELGETLAAKSGLKSFTQREPLTVPMARSHYEE